MRKLTIISKKFNNFRDVNESLVGKPVKIDHKKYPPIQDIIVKVKKMPGIKTKQVIFEKSNPILVRDGDKFTIEVLG